MTQAIETLPWDRLRELERKITEAAPPIDPPGCHWLNSDAGPSYCWPCAREAAWRQLPTIGPAPVEVDWWKRDPQEELIRTAIDGPMSGESDLCEHCTTCGCTLEYLLTEYGQEEELAHYAENPIAPDDVIGGEQTYALSRLFMNLDYEGADPAKVAEALAIAEGAWAAIQHAKAQP